jgi:hypothetical protein
MRTEPVQIGVDLGSRSLAADLLDSIAGFPLFVEELRANGEQEKVTSAMIDDLIRLFRQADDSGEDLSVLGAFVPDLLYIRISELEMMDQWTRVYTRVVPHLLLDQLRVRGICSFYILDNSIREDRFDALIKLFGDAGFSVISPNIDGIDEAEALQRIEYGQALRNHILYVERDATVNYLDSIRNFKKMPWYTVAFRNQAPTVNAMEFLQTAEVADRRRAVGD